MPTETIQVAAVTTPDQWTLGAGADKVVAVNGPDDDDTSYIYCSTSGRWETYSLAANAIPVGATINSVSVVSRGYKSSGSTARWAVGVLLGGSSTFGLTHFPASYTSYTETLARPGGGTWSVADLASVEVLVRFYNSGTIRVTSLWVSVDYTPPANTGQMLEMFN